MKIMKVFFASFECESTELLLFPMMAQFIAVVGSNFFQWMEQMLDKELKETDKRIFLGPRLISHQPVLHVCHRTRICADRGFWVAKHLCIVSQSEHHKLYFAWKAQRGATMFVSTSYTVMVAFSSLARILGECSTIHSPSALKKIFF